MLDKNLDNEKRVEFGDSNQDAILSIKDLVAEVKIIVDESMKVESTAVADKGTESGYRPIEFSSAIREAVEDLLKSNDLSAEDRLKLCAIRFFTNPKVRESIQAILLNEPESKDYEAIKSFLKSHLEVLDKFRDEYTYYELASAFIDALDLGKPNQIILTQALSGDFGNVDLSTEAGVLRATRKSDKSDPNLTYTGAWWNIPRSAEVYFLNMKVYVGADEKEVAGFINKHGGRIAQTYTISNSEIWRGFFGLRVIGKINRELECKGAKYDVPCILPFMIPFGDERVESILPPNARVSPKIIAAWQEALNSLYRDPSDDDLYIRAVELMANGRAREIFYAGATRQGCAAIKEDDGKPLEFSKLVEAILTGTYPEAFKVEGSGRQLTLLKAMIDADMRIHHGDMTLDDVIKAIEKNPLRALALLAEDALPGPGGLYDLAKDMMNAIPGFTEGDSDENKAYSSKVDGENTESNLNLDIMLKSWGGVFDFLRIIDHPSKTNESSLLRRFLGKCRTQFNFDQKLKDLSDPAKTDTFGNHLNKFVEFLTKLSINVDLYIIEKNSKGEPVKVGLVIGDKKNNQNSLQLLKRYHPAIVVSGLNFYEFIQSLGKIDSKFLESKLDISVAYILASILGSTNPSGLSPLGLLNMNSALGKPSNIPYRIGSALLMIFWSEYSDKVNDALNSGNPKVQFDSTFGIMTIVGETMKHFFGRYTLSQFILAATRKYTAIGDTHDSVSKVLLEYINGRIQLHNKQNPKNTIDEYQTLDRFISDLKKDKSAEGLARLFYDEATGKYIYPSGPLTAYATLIFENTNLNPNEARLSSWLKNVFGPGLNFGNLTGGDDAKIKGLPLIGAEIRKLLEGNPDAKVNKLVALIILLSALFVEPISANDLGYTKYGFSRVTIRVMFARMIVKNTDELMRILKIYGVYADRLNRYNLSGSLSKSVERLKGWDKSKGPFAQAISNFLSGDTLKGFAENILPDPSDPQQRRAFVVSTVVSVPVTILLSSFLRGAIFREFFGFSDPISLLGQIGFLFTYRTIISGFMGVFAQLKTSLMTEPVYEDDDANMNATKPFTLGPFSSDILGRFVVYSFGRVIVNLGLSAEMLANPIAGLTTIFMVSAVARGLRAIKLKKVLVPTPVSSVLLSKEEYKSIRATKSLIDKIIMSMNRFAYKTYPETLDRSVMAILTGVSSVIDNINSVYKYTPIWLIYFSDTIKRAKSSISLVKDGRALYLGVDNAEFTGLSEGVVRLVILDLKGKDFWRVFGKGRLEVLREFTSFIKGRGFGSFYEEIERALLALKIIKQTKSRSEEEENATNEALQKRGLRQ